MPLIISVILVIIAPVAALMLSRIRSVYVGGKKLPLREILKEEKNFFVIMSAVFVLVAVLTYFFIKYGAFYSWTAVQYCLFWEIICGCAFIDFKVKKIPNELLACAALIRLVGIITEIVVSGSPPEEIIAFSVIGGAAGGIIILLCRFFSKGEVGMGDVKIYAVTGFYFGLSGLLNIMIYSLFSAAIVAIFILVTKKGQKKSTLAMGPFILLGLTLYIVFRVGT